VIAHRQAVPVSAPQMEPCDKVYPETDEGLRTGSVESGKGFFSWILLRFIQATQL
jgi:hypothetical protein